MLTGGLTDATFEEIVEAIQAYSKRSHLMFALKKVDNFEASVVCVTRG